MEAMDASGTPSARSLSKPIKFITERGTRCSSRKPERVERLLKIADDHYTTLIDVRKEQVISQLHRQ